MEAPKPATIAWGILAAGVATYDVLCPQGETLSEGVDRAMTHPFGKAVVLGGIALTGAHLANLLPEGADPFHHALKWVNHAGAVIDDAMDVWGDE